VSDVETNPSRKLTITRPGQSNLGFALKSSDQGKQQKRTVKQGVLSISVETVIGARSIWNRGTILCCTLGLSGDMDMA
jgi:hypothetical protein